LKTIDAYHLDGDVVRKGLTSDLGFTNKDRTENIRRISHVCKILNNKGINVIASFISPTEKIRSMAKENVKPYRFILVHVNCSLEICIARDPKGLYKKALAGEISKFTGISAPYEEPKKPDVILNTDTEKIAQSTSKVLKFLEQERLIEGKHILFIGRWSPPHKAHKYLFDSVLNNGGRMCIAIRDTPISDKDPFTVEQRKQLLRKLYPNNPKVKIVAIPDINEVCVGRRVGYRIMAVPEKIRVVSATKVRKGKFDDVPEEIRDLVEKFIKDKNK